MDLAALGTALRSARKHARLSQGQVAERLGMSRATISAIERATIGEIGMRKVIALCGLLGLEVEIVKRPARPTLDELRNEARRA